MLRVYDVTLQWALRFRPITMVVFVLVLVATMYMFVSIPKGFIPDQDTDQMQVYHRSRAGHFVLPDGGVPEADRRDRVAGSRTSNR